MSHQNREPYQLWRLYRRNVKMHLKQVMNMRFFALSVTRHPFVHWTALNPLFVTAFHSLSHIFQREDPCLLLLLTTRWQSFPHNILARTDVSTTRARIVIYFSQYFTSSCTSFDDMARTIWTLCAYRVRKRFFSVFFSLRCKRKRTSTHQARSEKKEENQSCIARCNRLSSSSSSSSFYDH